MAAMAALLITASTGFADTPAAAQYGPADGGFHYTEEVFHVEFVCNEGERISGTVRNHVFYRPVETGNGWRYSFHYQTTFHGVSESGVRYEGHTNTQQIASREREDYPAPATYITIVTATQIGAGETTERDDLVAHVTVYYEITESGQLIVRVENINGDCS
jgi:hypothetical protein